MKQKQITSAYQTLAKLKDSELPIAAAYRLSLLLKQLEPLVNSQIELEKKLLQKYEGVVKEDGRVDFSKQNTDLTSENQTDEDRADAMRRMTGFANEVNELGEQEAEIDFKPIDLRLDSVGDVKLTLVDMTRLDGFINFIE